jgi:hypothetical protein
MKHERGIVGLWGEKIPLYWSMMAKTLYNIRLVGDRPFQGAQFDALMDGFAASMDVFPSCSFPARKRSAEKIWADFVKISEDINRTASKDVRAIPGDTAPGEQPRSPEKPQTYPRPMNAR